MKIKRSTIVMAIIFAMLFSLSVNAEEFSDISDSWAKEPLRKAVDNGLLKGHNGKINPNGELTRAELVTILNRALGTSHMTDISGYSDVDSTKWYYDELAKGVKAGLIKGDGKNLNPEGVVTREESFVIISRALEIENDEKTNLNFEDKNLVSDWAKKGVSGLIKEGYIKGVDGKLNPKNPITRAEFASLMNELVTCYAHSLSGEEGTIEGNVVINSSDVDLKGLTIKGDLIIAEGVLVDKLVLDNVTVTGRVLVRGGNEIHLTNNSKINKVIVSDDIKETVITIDKGSKVDSAYLKTKTSLEGKGKVQDVYVDEGADGSKVSIKDANVTEHENVKDIEIKEPTINKEKPTTNPPTYSGGGSSSGSGSNENDNSTDTPTKPNKPEENKLEVTEVTAVIDNAKIEVGKTAQITVKAKDAEGKAVEGVEYKYESDKEDVATVDKKGKVIGAAEGKAKITVTTTNAKEDQTATLDVEVVKADEVGETPVDPEKALTYTGETELTDTMPEEVKAGEEVVNPVITNEAGTIVEEFNIETAEAGKYTFTYNKEGYKELVITVTVSEEDAELTESKVEKDVLQLTFNRELTKEELDNVVKKHLRFQVTKVYRLQDESLVKMDNKKAKEKRLSEAKDLTTDEVNEILRRDREKNEENQGGWGGAQVDWNKLDVEVSEDGKTVTITVNNNLISHDDLTNPNKINSENAKDPSKGYKIGVHVGDNEYKIQLNTTSTDNSDVTGKFVVEK